MIQVFHSISSLIDAHKLTSKHGRLLARHACVEECNGRPLDQPRLPSRHASIAHVEAGSDRWLDLVVRYVVHKVSLFLTALLTNLLKLPVVWVNEVSELLESRLDHTL